MRHPGTLLRSFAWAAFLLAAAGSARAQVMTTPPQPVRGPGIAVSPGLLSGASPADTVATFAPFLSTVSLVPRYLVDSSQPRPAAPESFALETYLQAERQRREQDAWQQALLAGLAGEAPAPGDTLPRLGGALRLPREITSLVGPAALDVNGRLRVSLGGGKTTLDPDLRPPGFPGNDFNLDLDQIFELGIRGTVGRKVNLAVDYNSEREFENKNILSAFYVGDEDEILKRVELGDIAVSLPPSRFINAGATKGNFGVQGIAQLGPVDLRGIASQKEGETTERRLTITPRTQGVIETNTVELKDTQYQNNRYFLMFHPDSLSASRIAFPNQGTALANPESRPSGTSLNVWLDNGNPTDDLATDAKFGTTHVNPQDESAFPDETQQGFFNLLTEGQDYYVVDNVILVTDRELNANEKLAVSYITEAGDTLGSLQDADTLELKLIKPVNPDSLDFTWDYTMRNVYPLRGSEVLLQSVSIYRGNQQLRVDLETVSGRNVKFSQLLGVADSSERPLTQAVGRDPFGGPDFLVFPDLRPVFQPSSPDPPGFVLLTVPNGPLYRIPPEQRLSATQNQVYFIDARYLGKSGPTNEIELGALNILEGSETITIGGVTLQRGKDYQIFYDFGRLVFAEADALFARFPNSQIEIDFEVAPLFNLAPTNVAGFNAVYRKGDNLFVNSSVLLQSTESLSNRPILGAEPTRSLVGEVDGNYDLDLPFLTEVLDDLPLMRARGRSGLRLRGEMALNQPNPNTDGEVFLNDFEGVQIADAISLNNRTYLFGSAPEGLGFVPQNAREILFTTQVAPIGEVTTQEQVGSRAVVEVMRVDLREPVVAGVPPANTWRSISHRISIEGADVSRREAVEFFVGPTTQGHILVDLGTMSEDGVRFSRASQPQGEAVGQGQLDSEDANRDNQLDASEDVGLDRVPGDDTAGVPGDDGNDDFNLSLNPEGTEDNDVLDSEDLNLNGALDQSEDLLRWDVDLAASTYEVPGSLNDNGFRKIRLPLARPDAVVGTPDLRRVQAIRLTFAGFDVSLTANDLELAALQIVGSSFLERGVVDSLGVPIAGDRSDSLAISEVNTLEDPSYDPPPGVSAEQESADEIIRTGLQPLQEQSLVFGYDSLPAGAEARIYQPLNDRESYLDYQRMRIFTNGQAQFTSGGPVFDRQPTFFVEFGDDTLNVYRFQAPLLLNGWEEHDIDFDVFRELKAQLLDSLAAAGADTGSIASPDGRYRVMLRDSRTQPPTLSQVSQLTIGLLNDIGQEIREGSFWVDEWRLTDPVTDGGTAYYLSASSQIADFGIVDLQLEGRDARVRNLNALVNNQTSRDFDVRTAYRLDKLLPAALGIEMPLTFDHFATNDQPLFLVGQDIELASDATLRERQEIDNRQTIATLALRRSQRSRNGLLRATVDRLSARFSTRTLDFESVDTDRADDAWDLTLRYDTDFAPKPIPLPFRFLGGLPLPGFVKDSKGFRSFVNMDLNLLPSRVALTGTRIHGENQLTKRQGVNAFSGSALDSLVTADSARTLTGDVTVTMQPTSSLRANYSLSSTRDLNFPEPEDVDLGDSPWPGIETLRAQRFDVQWTPPVTDWLIPRYNYNVSFGLTHTRETSRVLQGDNLFDFNNQVAKGWTVELNVPVLLDRARGSGPRPGAPGAPPSARGGFDLLTVLQPIRFETTKRQSSGFRQIEEEPSLAFTFGLQDPEDLQEDAQNIAELDRLAVKSGLAPLPNMLIQGGYEHNENQRVFFGGTNDDDQTVWPDANLRWSLATVPGFLGAVLDRVDVTSAYRSEDGATRAQGLTLTRYDRARWGPLVGVDATWLGGLITNFRIQQVDNDTVAVRGGSDDSVRSETATDMELTLNYMFRPGAKVYFPIPFLMGERIKGPLRTSLTMARRRREDVTEQVDGAGEAQASGLNIKTTTIEIRPALSYDLSRFSSGLAFSYLLRQDEKRDVDTATYNVELFVDLIL